MQKRSRPPGQSDASVGGGSVALWHLFDDVEEFGAVVAALAGESDQLDRPCDERAPLWRARDVDAVASAEFEQSFIAENAHRAKDGVGVDAHHGCEVSGRWEPLARLCFPIGDCSPELSRDLVVKERWVCAVDLDI
jgi:hypothetical protein